MTASSRVALSGRTTLVYLARGAQVDFRARFDRFVSAYQAHRAGLSHDLAIIFKGFRCDRDLEVARTAFEPLSFLEIHTDDASFDIGAYGEAARTIEADRICFLNTNSEPAAEDWLLKLAVNLEQPGIGLVGATGSFQTHRGSDYRFPPFPNLHVRSNAFMLRGLHARNIVGNFKICAKRDAYLAECGHKSITRQIIDLGLAPLIVGRNGRGYAPEWWSRSRTYAQGAQENVLVHDNQTRSFQSLPAHRKRDVELETWGALPGPPFGRATP